VSKKIPLILLTDSESETNETIGLRLHSVTGADVAKREGRVTLIDNDDPELSVQAVNVNESNGFAEVVVSLSAPSNGEVSVSLATSSASAEAGRDFFGIFQELSFERGEISKRASVEILDDTERESTESINLRLFNPKNARIVDSAASITILDDD